MSMREIERYYFRVEVPQVRQRIAEFKEEMGGWGKCKRLDYLYDRLIELDLELLERWRDYKRSTEQDRPYIERALIAAPIPDIEKKIKKLEKEIEVIVHKPRKGNELTPETIEQARQYPIESFIEVKRGVALCPFHDDNHPSMGIKNNRFHCFACGAKGDVIEFMMKREGLSFKDAVIKLGGV